MLWVKSGMSNCTYASLKIRKSEWCYQMAKKPGIQMLLHEWERWLNLEAGILPTCGTGKINALAWHPNLWHLSFGLSEWVLTNHSYPEETEEGKVSASSKNASSSTVLTESLRIESRPCWKSLFGTKGVILKTSFKWEVGKFWHLSCETRVNMWSNNEALHKPCMSKFINLIPNHHTSITW